MEREEFFKLIETKGFKVSDIKCPLGCDRYFETVISSDGWSDGYSNKYILAFEPTFGIKIKINKISEGGFTGTQKIDERLFYGAVETEEEFNTLLKLIGFEK